MKENAAQHMDIVRTALQGFSLSDVEVTVYTTILKLGSRSAGGLSKFTGINRTYTYDVLASLERKELIQESEKNGIKHYSCTDLERLLETLENREREATSQKELLKSSIPDLSKLLNTRSTEISSVGVLDANGVESVYEEMLCAPGREIFSFVGRRPKANTIPSENSAISRFSKRREQLGIWYRSIVNDLRRAGPRSFGELSELRVLDSLEMPSELIVFGEVVSLISENDKKALVLKNPALAKSLQTIHQALWQLLPRT